MSHTIEFLGDGEAEARAKLDSGTPEQAVRSALSLARDWATGAANNLVAITGGKDRVRDPLGTIRARYQSEVGKAFLLFLGWNESDGQDTLDKVETGLTTLVDRLNKGVTVKVRPASGWRSGRCNETRNGYQVGELRPRTINLCPAWFERTPEHRAAIINHELMHAIGDWFGTTDQSFDNGRKVDDQSSALAFAEVDPKDAAVNPENYEQFFQYRAIVNTFPKIGQSGWPGVPANLDGALMHPNGKAYFFKGAQYYRYVEGQGVDKVGEIGKDGWWGVPHDIDSCCLHPNGKAYFFKRRQYWRYSFEPFDDVQEGVDKTGTVGRDGWNGLDGWIDAMLTMPASNTIHVFEGINVRKFDVSHGVDKVVAARFVRDGGFSSLYGHLDAAFYYPPRKTAYFFTGGHYQRIPLASLPT